MKSTMLAPIVSVLALLLQLLIGVEIPQEVQDKVAFILADALFVGTTIWGIVKNHKKEA